MKTLRRLEKATNRYKILMKYNQEKLKKYNCMYMEDVNMLLEITNNYIESASKEFNMWIDTSISIFMDESNGIFHTIRKKIDIAVVNHFLNSLCYKLAKAGKIKNYLEIVQTRLKQFKYIG